MRVGVCSRKQKHVYVIGQSRLWMCAIKSAYTSTSPLSRRSLPRFPRDIFARAGTCKEEETQLERCTRPSFEREMGLRSPRFPNHELLRRRPNSAIPRRPGSPSLWTTARYQGWGRRLRMGSGTPPRRPSRRTPRSPQRRPVSRTHYFLVEKHGDLANSDILSCVNLARVGLQAQVSTSVPMYYTAQSNMIMRSTSYCVVLRTA